MAGECFSKEDPFSMFLGVACRIKSWNAPTYGVFVKLDHSQREMQANLSKSFPKAIRGLQHGKEYESTKGRLNAHILACPLVSPPN